MGQFLAVAIAVLAAMPATASQVDHTLTPTWVKRIKAGGWLGAPENGRCLVISESGTVSILDASGKPSWSWPYARINRFISPRVAAVTPECDAIAIPGSSSYRYTWVVERSGKSVSIQTSSTPISAAFDRTGQLVAIGTSGGTLQLHDRSGVQQWKRVLRGALIVDDLAFSDDNTDILFRGWGGAGVVGVDGQVRWAELANRFAASRDLKTLVFSSEPNHGPGLPAIHVTDGSHKDLWGRWALVDAFVSADGDRILATVDLNQAKAEQDFFAEPQQRVAQLLSRRGDVIASFPESGEAAALADDGKRLWLRSTEALTCVSDDGIVLATIRMPADPLWTKLGISRNFEQVIAAYQEQREMWRVELYSVPAPCRQ